MSDSLRDGAWRGQPAILLGGGASVKEEPEIWAWADAAQRGCRRMIVSGCGEILARDGYREDAWLSIDRPFWSPGEGYSRSGPFGVTPPQPPRAPRIWVRPPGEPSLRPGLVDLEIPRVGADYEEGLTRSLEEGLYVAGNSGYAALGLVWHLGADPVYLLGFDCQPGEWHTPGVEHPRELYDRWMAASLRLAARFAEVGRRVYWIGSGAAAPGEALWR